MRRGPQAPSLRGIFPMSSGFWVLGLRFRGGVEGFGVWGLGFRV